MCPLCIQMPNVAAEEMADAARDDKKLLCALIGGGTAKAAAALLLALSRAPGGVFLRDRLLFYAYYAILVVVALFGSLEVAVGFWVSGDPDRRRGWGQMVMWASVVPLVLVAGLGGFAVLK